MVLIINTQLLTLLNGQKICISKLRIGLVKSLLPYLENGVEEKGFLIFPYIYLKNWDKGLDEGLIYWPQLQDFHRDILHFGTDLCF